MQGNSHPLSFQLVTTALYKDRIEQVVLFNNVFFPHPTPQMFMKISDILMSKVLFRNVALVY